MGGFEMNRRVFRVIEGLGMPVANRQNRSSGVNGTPLALCRLERRSEGRHHRQILLTYANQDFLDLFPAIIPGVARLEHLLPHDIQEHFTVKLENVLMTGTASEINAVPIVGHDSQFYIDIAPLTADTAALKFQHRPANHHSSRNHQKTPITNRLGFWEYSEGKFNYDSGICNILGGNGDNLTLDLLSKRIPANELKDFHKKYECAVRRKRNFSKQHRITGFDGRELHLLQRIRIDFDAEGKPVKTTGAVYDVSSLKKNEQTMEQQNHVLHSLIYSTQQLLGASSIHIGISNSLRSFGLAANASRAFVYRFINHKNNYCAELVNEWDSRNHPRMEKRYFEVDIDHEMFKRLSAHQPIVVKRREATGPLLQMMSKWNLQSFMLFPVTVNNQIYGFVGISDLFQERNWSTAEIDILQLYAETIGLAIERDIREQELNEMIVRSSQNEVLLTNSEIRYRSILKALPDLLFIYDNKGVILDYSAPSSGDLYVRPEDFLGRSCRDVLPAEVADLSMNAIREVFETKQVVQYQYDLEISGEIRQFDARMVPLGNDKAMVIIRNITIQQRMEKALVSSENKFRLLFDRMQSAAAVFEPVFDSKLKLLRYRFIDVNSRYEVFSGISRTNILNRFIEDVYPDDYGSWQNLLRKVSSIGSNGTLEFHNKSTDKYFSCCAFRPDDKIDYFCVMFNDITSLKQTQNALTAAKEKAEESDRLKSAFLSNMSHEIRTPLNTIIGLANLITEQEPDAEEKKEYSTIINQSSSQLLTLISDIIDIAKIESNQLPITKRNLCINDVMEKLYEMHYAQLRKNDRKKLHLSCSRPLNHDEAIIHTDETRLQQVLNNLINNAVKFTTQGSVEMGYSLSENRREIMFYVKDSGPGIPAAKQEIIFERFRQADDSFTRLYGGAGLGLTICKNLVELMGGRIWVNSIVGKGSCFYFTLPYERKEETQSQKLPRLLPEKRLARYSWPDKTVLVVEDTPTVLYYLRRILEMADVKCLTASNGREAIDICSTHHDIDLILMDIQMPEMNGFEATEKIRERWPNLPVIAQTAYAYSSEIERALACGCCSYLVKPLKKIELLTRLADFFGRGE